MYEDWVLDATLSDGEPPYCWCPIEGDVTTGDFKVIVGFTMMADRPPGKIVAVVHADGIDAVTAWADKHMETVARAMKGALNGT